jgi:predicted DNA-binding transcriptional regulator YafY
MAGIPIVTTQGGTGGISIADGYRIDKSVLTYDEMQKVVTALKGMDSISPEAGTEQLLNKFFVKKDQVLSIKDSIIINLASHYKSDLANKIPIIREAILDNKLISFHYYSSKGDTERTIEPCYLAFQWSAWYVFGYCRERRDFRLFKLNRLCELKNTGIRFEPREITEGHKDFDRYFTDEYQITVLFDPEVKYRLIDEYGKESFEVNEEGKLLFRMGFTNKNYMLSWILSFGDKAEVLYPKGLKQEIRSIAENILKHYQ